MLPEKYKCCLLPQHLRSEINFRCLGNTTRMNSIIKMFSWDVRGRSDQIVAFCQ